ncbi:complex 1 LYR family protein [Nitzschia inconspicua]|uniref:Complex 1 LYR family protein n=1 Tax=Nitzschia inconspicua TaxID=303405 RepID=A0A9K3KYA7_9STRA|nr:complex 1 LYR family protein [Nitzschia inconspicua]
MYRDFFRAIRHTVPHNQDELKAQVRREFKAHRQQLSLSQQQQQNQNQSQQNQSHDPFLIQRAVTEGKRRLRELQDFTGQSNGRYQQEGQSWIDIQDPDDPRGRIGTGWPWQKK